MRTGLPRNVRHELSLRVRYPKTVETPAGPVRFRRSRWEHLNEGRDEPRLRHREAAAWLHDAAGERIALLEVEEFDMDPGLVWDEFWYWADGLSQQAGDAVLAMREAWSGEQFVTPADYGSIALITGAWIAPAHRTRIDQRAVLDATLAAVAPGHAIAVLIAYPAGYDDDAAPEAQGEPAALGNFEWRQKAMMRLYARVLGFEALPVREARREVMWRPRPDLAGSAIRPG